MQQSKGSTSYKVEWYSLTMGLRIFFPQKDLLTCREFFIHCVNPNLPNCSKNKNSKTYFPLRDLPYAQ